MYRSLSNGVSSPGVHICSRWAGGETQQLPLKGITTSAGLSLFCFLIKLLSRWSSACFL